MCCASTPIYLEINTCPCLETPQDCELNYLKATLGYEWLAKKSELENTQALVNVTI
jgi:hypothetical protein